jgi:CheY-like chemotaxis protein
VINELPPLGANRWVRALSDLLFILVVEDDAPIQCIVEDALADGGFEPAIAASGEEAVTLLKGNKGKYRALVTDIQLRGVMEGWEVAKKAREIDPEFPIVYLTGGYAAEWPSRGVPNSILLTKPFAPAQLVSAVSQLLNAKTLIDPAPASADPNDGPSGRG